MKKYLAIALLLWGFLIISSYGWNIQDYKREVEYISVESAKIFFEQIVLERSWIASHGGVYVPITEKTQPNKYLTDPFRDITTTDGLHLTKINPAFMTRQISEIASNTNGVQFHITSLNPIRPENKPTDWERDCLISFEQGTTERYEFIEENKNDTVRTLFRYMAPLFVKEGCLNCHSKQKYKLGDIRGGISVTLPYVIQHNDLSLVTSHVIALLLGIFGIILASVQLQKNHQRLINSNEKKENALKQSELLSAKLKKKNNELAKSHEKQDEVHQKLELSHLELSKAHKDLKNTQVQMLQNDKMASIGQLAAGIAHEINNPIGFVSSNLGTLHKYTNRILDYMSIQEKILCDNNLDTQTQEARDNFKIDYIVKDSEELLAESIDGAKRVTEIVQNLKSFARIDQDKLSNADINECFESTLRIIWNELKYKITIIKEYGTLPLTSCNPQELNQVFMNIILNASQAIQANGEIIISTKCVDDDILISISDNGDGIKPENLEHIFEPFFTTKEIGKGTGLGLSICYDIIKKHNGEITATSELGKGTTFNITLPIKTVDNQKPELTSHNT